MTSGSGNSSFSCASIPNYKNLTVNDFILKITSINGSSGSFSDQKDKTVSINGSISFSVPTLSYNNSNGLLTISGMSYSYSMSKWWAGYANQLWNGSNTYNWDLYLI